MKILISNDDGYFAPGIQTLFASLKAHPFIETLTLIAPDRNRSAASNSLTLVNPLRTTLVSADSEQKIAQYSVNGTPTDCVHLAINGALGFQPDMVISGINAGANMGDDVLYSGTVAAATEGRFLGKPSLAISLCGSQHFASAAHYFLQLFDALPQMNLAADTILNINVPDLPIDQIKGFKVTRLGRRHASEPVVSQLDPRGLPIFWIGPAGAAADASEGTDFHAVEQGYVSITPLKIDLTNYAAMKALIDWADQAVTSS
ncbi:MAG: 5'/3'-nucleotidase SurE [Thiotrichales bacterium]|nr:5'/3'-nucleotidase SurE [Thiotrichales bacterium]